MKSALPLLAALSLLTACGGTVTPTTPEPTSPQPTASTPVPDPTPTPTPTPSPSPTPQAQWQPPDGWNLYVTDQGQRLAYKQRQSPSCDGRLYCADFEIMPSVPCRNGVYMEVQWTDPNTNAVEDWGNDFLPRLDAGQIGRLSTGIDWKPKSFSARFSCHS